MTLLQKISSKVSPETEEVLKVLNYLTLIFHRCSLWIQWNYICLRSDVFRKDPYYGGGNQRPNYAGHHPKDRQRHLQPHLLHGGEPGVPHQGLIF